MKKLIANDALTLLEYLGVPAYTDSHINLIVDFMERKDKDIKALLTSLGSWDNSDLAIAEKWLNQLNYMKT